MLFYESVEPLSNEKHAQWRIKPGVNCSFAAKTNAIPLLGQEFAAAQADYAIAFVKVGETDVLPVAVVGVRDGENLFVAEDGQWEEGAYIPAYVRRFPLAPAASGDQMIVCIENASGLVGPFEEGTPLFENGQPTEALKQSLTLVEVFHRHSKITEAFCKKLQELDLLVPVQAEVKAAGAEGFRIEGMLAVEEQRLNKISDQDALELFRSGMLGWIHAHLLSFKSIGRMAKRVR